VMVVATTLTDEAVIEAVLAKMAVEEATETLIEVDEALTEDPTLTATTVAVPTLTPTRGEDDPPILTARSAPVSEGFTLLFTMELDFTEVTARATTGSARGTAMARPQKIVARARNFMLR
jgi:hypothetical protein